MNHPFVTCLLTGLIFDALDYLNFLFKKWPVPLPPSPQLTKYKTVVYNVVKLHSRKYLIFKKSQYHVHEANTKVHCLDQTTAESLIFLSLIVIVIMYFCDPLLSFPHFLSHNLNSVP